jgi:hypothetical protein
MAGITGNYWLSVEVSGVDVADHLHHAASGLLGLFVSASKVAACKQGRQDSLRWRQKDEPESVTVEQSTLCSLP